MRIIDDEIDYLNQTKALVDIVIEQEQGLRPMVCHRCHGEMVTMGYVALAALMLAKDRLTKAAKAAKAARARATKARVSKGTLDKGKGGKGKAR